MKISNQGNRYYHYIYLELFGYCFRVEVIKASFQEAIRDCYDYIQNRELDKAERTLKELKELNSDCVELTRLDIMWRKERIRQGQTQ